MTDYKAPETSALDALLVESGQPESPELKAVLLELRSLGSGPAPAPSAELHALLAAPRPATCPAGAPTPGPAQSSTLLHTAPNNTEPKIASQLPRPIPLHRKRRGAVVSLGVVAAMGLGVGAAAAASGDFRGAAQHVISGIVHTVLPHSSTSPTDRKAGPGPNPVHPAAPSLGSPSPALAQPAAGKESDPPAPVPSAGPGNGTGGSRASLPPSAAKPTAPQLPALPEEAAHGLPSWLVRAAPPAVPPGLGKVGKNLPVPVPHGPGSGLVPLPTQPAQPDGK